jgi:tRNA U34 5-methylaminomethyl-2-thiouridine-forming methyltransferase MnmC
LYAGQFDEHYHSIHGSLQESNHVFIQAGLAFAAQNRQHLKIFEMGLGTGLNVLLTLDFAKINCLSIDYHAIELYPIAAENIKLLERYPVFNRPEFLKLHQTAPNPTLPLNDNFLFTKYHQNFLDFETKILFDLVYYDAFAPSAQPELWTLSTFQKIYNFMNNSACLVTYCAKGEVKRNLKSAGFTIGSLPGPKGKREMTRAIR